MSDARRHGDHRNFIEQILHHIPGFKGYLDKEYRREADAMIRGATADRIQETKRSLDTYMQTLVDANTLDDLPKLEHVRARLDKIASMIRGDVRGYSGFFDYARVDERLLASVYDYDAALLEDAKTLATSTTLLNVKPDAPKAVAADLNMRIDAIENKFQRRREMLSGVAE